MLSIVYLLICQMLYVICRLSYTKSHMLIFYMLKAVCKLLQVYSQISYMPVLVPVYACSMLDLAWQLQYTCIYMPAHKCQISVERCQVSLYINLSCYMSNCYISVYMPSVLFQELYAECYGIYAKLHMLDWNMPNAMTIAMSFSMTTEQVGHFIIYMSIIRLWLSILPL
jgi:hypothetical protein